MRAIHTIRTRLIQCCLDGQVELIRIKWPIEDRFQNCVFEPVCSRTVQERFLKIEIKNLKKKHTQQNTAIEKNQFYKIGLSYVRMLAEKLTELFEPFFFRKKVFFWFSQEDIKCSWRCRSRTFFFNEKDRAPSSELLHLIRLFEWF